MNCASFYVKTFLFFPIIIPAPLLLEFSLAI